MQEGIDFVECRICGLNSGSLSRHIGVHGVSAVEYRACFPDAKLVAEVVRSSRIEKLKSKPKKEPRLVCKYCGGRFNNREILWKHEKQETALFINGVEGTDYVVCQECGLRNTNIVLHLKTQHSMSLDSYRIKYSGAAVVLDSVVAKRVASIIALGRSKPRPERKDATQCPACNEWYFIRNNASHLSCCVAANADKYELNRDYVRCPDCGIAFSRLGGHLKDKHGWDKDKIAIEVGRGLQLMASCVADKWRAKQDFQSSQEKREQTHLERYGFSNPFANPDAQSKMVVTSRRRYGVAHPMQNEDVFARQTDSAHRGPSGQEKFFDEHTCDNVVYCGYGGRFIRTKTGVHKYGRLIKDLNPDFIVLPSNVLESALVASKEHQKMSREKHRSKYVIELLGDYYHSEGMIGVKPEDHEKEIIEAYKSAGIECLVLWEKDVMSRWEAIRPMVDAWIDKAVKDMNEHPLFSRATKDKV